MYQPAQYQFRLTVLIDGGIAEQYIQRLSEGAVWVWMREKSAELAEMYAAWAVRVEYVS